MKTRRPSKVAAFVASAALLGLASCVNPGERMQEQRTALDAQLHARIGVSTDRSAAAGLALQAEREASLSDLAAGPLDADAAVRAAFVLQPRVRELLFALDAAAASRVKAGLLANPLLGLQATAASGGARVDLTLVQPLFDWLSVAARRATADRELEVARLRATDELIEFAFDVRRVWTEARAAEDVEGVAAERLEAEEAAARLARELDAAGNLTPAFLAEIESASAEARLERLAAAEKTRRAREQLASRIGAPELVDTLRLAAASEIGPQPMPAAADLEAAALHSNLALAEQEARTRTFELHAGLEPWRARLGGSHAGVALQRESGDWGAGPRLDVPLPLFDDGRADRAVWISRAEAARQRRERIVLLVRSAARGASDRLVRLLEISRAATEDALPSARRRVDAILQQYNAMQVGVFDVVEARRGELDAARRAIESTRDAALARLDLERLLAGGLPADFTTHEAPVSNEEP